MDAEIASNDQSNDDHTHDGEDAHGALISLRTWLSCGFHYAFTLVVVIGPAYWTLGEGMGRRLSASVALGIAPRPGQGACPRPVPTCVQALGRSTWPALREGHGLVIATRAEWSTLPPALLARAGKGRERPRQEGQSEVNMIRTSPRPLGRYGESAGLG